MVMVADPGDVVDNGTPIARANLDGAALPCGPLRLALMNDGLSQRLEVTLGLSPALP